MTWQIWITDNFRVLKYWSSKWSFYESDELLQCFAEYLEKNWSKFSQIPDGEQRIKFCQKWFKNNVIWQTTEFNKIIQKPHLPFFEEIYEDEFFCEEVDLDLTPEEIDSDLSDEQIYKVRRIAKVYKTLSTEEKVLFDLYFTEMLSQRQIANKINIPLSAVYNMLKALKQKIKDEL